MQTTYFNTSRFICHRGNVVDLSAYRERLAAVSGEGFPPVLEVGPAEEAPPTPDLTLVEAPRRRGSLRRRRERETLAFWMEVCASGAVVLFAISAMMQFLRVF